MHSHRRSVHQNVFWCFVKEDCHFIFCVFFVCLFVFVFIFQGRSSILALNMVLLKHVVLSIKNIRFVVSSSLMTHNHDFCPVIILFRGIANHACATQLCSHCLPMQCWQFANKYPRGFS
jgi:hypothetical protein